MSEKSKYKANLLGDGYIIKTSVHEILLDMFSINFYIPSLCQDMLAYIK